MAGILEDSYNPGSSVKETIDIQMVNDEKIAGWMVPGSKCSDC